MKRILPVIAFLLCATAMWAKGELEFQTVTHDFGTVSQTAAPVSFEYEFTNVSDEPVAVLSASAQCGCTKPDYPVKPIAPGKKGRIKVTFLPAGQKGAMTKDVKVRWRGAKARRSQSVTLRFDINVVPAE